MDMGLSRSYLILFRVALSVTLIAVTCLATLKLEPSVTGNINDKVSHVMAFGVLAFLLDFSFPKSGFSLMKMMTLIGYGVFIEIIQYFIPYREFSLLDMAADSIGLIIYVVFLPAIKRLPVLDQRWKKTV